MVVIKVVALFEDRAELLQARGELLRAQLATEETVHTEPDIREDPADPAPEPTGWERLKAVFETEADHDVSAYAEGLRRGNVLLVVETASEHAENVKDVMRRNGAIDLRRRVHRWITTGWDTFEPDAPRFTELEILDERRASLSEAAIAADVVEAGGPDRTVALFDEATEGLIGHISEEEFAVIREALEMEGPDDDDYWINDEEIAGMAPRAGATPHLIALLRRAVSRSTDGVDIRFERGVRPADARAGLATTTKG